MTDQVYGRGVTPPAGGRGWTATAGCDGGGVRRRRARRGPRLGQMQEFLPDVADISREVRSRHPLLLHLSLIRDSPASFGRPIEAVDGLHPQLMSPTILRPVRQVVSDHGGLVATHELYSAGWDRHSLAVAVGNRSLIRVRQGWYGLPDLHPTLVRALRVGGPATCVTGLELHGAWVVRDPNVHARVHPHGSRLRDPRNATRRLASGAVAHWRGTGPLPRLILDPVACLDDMLQCSAPEFVAAAADSVLHQWPHVANRWSALLATASDRAKRNLAMVDGVCESGTETVIWQRIGARLGFRRQVTISGVGRVDFLFGERQVIEADGFEYHADRDEFEEDRRRDAVLSAQGLRSLRFGYKQVFERWWEVEAAILGARARGDHL